VEEKTQPPTTRQDFFLVVKNPRLGLLFPDSKHKAKSGKGAGNKRAGI